MNNTDFSELIITADVHEQANCKVRTRILGLQKFVEELGGCFQEEHLGDGYGLDYKAEGYYKGKEISLGVEYKVFLNDFVPNHGILEKRFGAAREHYNNIALVIEGESLAKTSHIIGDKNIWYVNPAVVDGSADQMMNRQMFEDRMQAWAESGVLVRNIKVEDDFPITFLYLLEYITKDEDWYTKHKISLPNTSFENQYINTILSFGIEKVGQKTAKKVTKLFPNLFWLCEAHEDHLKDALGKVTGKNISDFIHNNSLITVEWQNGGSKTQMSKETEKSLKSNPEQSISNPELKYLDENEPKFKEVSRKVINDGKIDFGALLEKDQENRKKYKETILNIIKQSTKGIEIEHLYYRAEVNNVQQIVIDAIVKDLMQDGEIYEPKIGLLVATNRDTQTDQEPELLLSSPRGTADNPASKGAGSQSCGQSDKSSKQSVPTNDNSITQKATESDKVANLSDSDLGTVSKSSITDDQPKAILNSTHLNPPPSAASSICEPPDNSEFKSNPYLRDIENFIRKGGKSLDEIGKEFGLSEMMTLKGVNVLMVKHRVWFCKADKKIYFGGDKNPAPVVADKPLDIGLGD